MKGFHLSFHPPIHYPSIYHLSVCPPVHLSTICPSIRLSIHPSSVCPSSLPPLFPPITWPSIQDRVLRSPGADGGLLAMVGRQDFSKQMPWQRVSPCLKGRRSPLCEPQGLCSSSRGVPSAQSSRLFLRGLGKGPQRGRTAADASGTLCGLGR